MKITLVRHTSVDVPSGTCYGQTDVALRSTFTDEAKAVRHKLKDMKFDKAFTSPLSRCTRLAEFCGYGDAERDDRLKELDFGEWEMQRFDDITDPRLQEWYADYFNVAPTGGESAAMQNARVRDFLEELKGKDYKDVVIFTHGGVMMQSLLITGQSTIETLFNRLPPYGGIITIEI